MREQRDRLVVELRALGVSVVDSDANFVLFGGFPNAPLVWRKLLDDGVLVRDVGIPGWLRVTAGTQAETTAFLEAMRRVVTGPIMTVDGEKDEKEDAQEGPKEQVAPG